MSELLKQAITDATALKEAAIKHAENALIEKYSVEFNQTVKKLLEQEEPPAEPSAEPSLPPPPEVSAAPSADLPAGTEMGSIDPMDDVAATTPASEKAFGAVPAAYGEDDDNTLITINFNEIQYALNEMMNLKERAEGSSPTASDVTTDALAAGGNKKVHISITGEKTDSKNSLFASEEDGEEELELDLAEDSLVGSSDIQGADGTEQLEEDIDLTEEELLELAEQLRVDLDVSNPSDGYMGITVTQKREQRDTELAAARDAKAAEEREKEKEAMSDLIKESNKIKKMNLEATNTILALKEQLQKVNILNAKLLYTNKALGNISLNERQKQSIVESISKADSVLAAKTIYETLQNATEKSGQEKAAPQTLRETLNRAPSPFVVRKTANSGPTDLAAERLKALAGIK